MATIHIQVETPRYVGWSGTPAEYFALAPDGYRYTMIGGKLELSPSGSFEHSVTSARLVARLIDWEKNHPVRVCPELDCRFGDVIKRPDVAVYRARAFPTRKAWPIESPVVAIEVITEYSKTRDLAEKRQLYLEHGVDELWIADCRDLNFFAFENVSDAWREFYPGPEAEFVSRALTGLAFDPRAMFLPPDL